MTVNFINCKFKNFYRKRTVLLCKHKSMTNMLLEGSIVAWLPKKHIFLSWFHRHKSQISITRSLINAQTNPVELETWHFGGTYRVAPVSYSLRVTYDRRLFCVWITIISKMPQTKPNRVNTAIEPTKLGE